MDYTELTDKFIARLPSLDDGDLAICEELGVAYQREVRPFHYGILYFDHYKELEGSEIARKINAGRVALVNKHCGPETHVLDVGVGSGEFILSRPNTSGYDVNQIAQRWLKNRHLWADAFESFSAFTFWDVLEHVENPEDYFSRMPKECFLFTCLPVFDDLKRVRESKHYKPNEHLYYWTQNGFVDWIALYGFRFLETQLFETEAGRENITSFAFRRI